MDRHSEPARLEGRRGNPGGIMLIHALVHKCGKKALQEAIRVLYPDRTWSSQE